MGGDFVFEIRGGPDDGEAFDTLHEAGRAALRMSGELPGMSLEVVQLGPGDASEVVAQFLDGDEIRDDGYPSPFADDE